MRWLESPGEPMSHQKGALGAKRKVAALKAAQTRRQRDAGRKAARTKRLREAARNAAFTRKLNEQAMRRDGASSVRALTIRQPWAELILRRRKPYELRGWSTKYRGPLIIHSAARVDSAEALQLDLNPDELVSGAFVGIAVLADVRKYTKADHRILKRNRAETWGWSPGLFSWVLTNVRRLSPPVKAKGQLGLIKVSAPMLRRIARLSNARA